MSGEDDGTNRRTVLKRLGAAAATGTALTGTAAADSGETSSEAIVRHYEGTADDLLASLSEAGLIETASAAALSTEPVAPGTVAAGRPGATTLSLDDAVGSREVTMSVTPVERGTLRVFVEPARDLAYAYLDAAGSDQTVAYGPDGSTVPVEEGNVGVDYCGGCSCSGIPCGTIVSHSLEVCEFHNPFTNDCYVYSVKCDC